MSYIKQKGFTLIELVMVMIIIGILAAIAVPKFINLSDEALQAAKYGMEGAVRSAWTIAYVDKHKDGATLEPSQEFPTVQEIIDHLNGGENVADLGSGVQVEINGLLYEVPTFSDINCATATGQGDQVQCVGSITPGLGTSP